MNCQLSIMNCRDIIHYIVNFLHIDSYLSMIAVNRYIRNQLEYICKEHIKKNLYGLHELEYLCKLSTFTASYVMYHKINIKCSEIGEYDYVYSTSFRSTAYDLKKFPYEITFLHKLEIIDLSDNNICSISKYINKLQSLYNLRLYNNNIKIIPNELYQLSKLVILNLTKNNISHIPNQIVQLYNLRELYLNHNDLIELGGIIYLNKLLILSVNYNNLRYIPFELYKFPYLEMLSICKQYDFTIRVSNNDFLYKNIYIK